MLSEILRVLCLASNPQTEMVKLLVILYNYLESPLFTRIKSDLKRNEFRRLLEFLSLVRSFKSSLPFHVTPSTRRFSDRSRTLTRVCKIAGTRFQATLRPPSTPSERVADTKTKGD